MISSATMRFLPCQGIRARGSARLVRKGQRGAAVDEIAAKAVTLLAAEHIRNIMTQLDTRQKLEILADAAKYDASCASSGSVKRDSRGGRGIGSTDAGMGICHAYAPDGRCTSLLKILLTNSCIFDCHYCINRKSSNVRRARFTPQEVADLTLSFYQSHIHIRRCRRTI